MRYVPKPGATDPSDGEAVLEISVKQNLYIGSEDILHTYIREMVSSLSLMLSQFQSQTPDIDSKFCFMRPSGSGWICLEPRPTENTC